MHQPVWDGLENYLEGKPDVQFTAHLAECEECRLAVSEMKEQALWVRSLNVSEEVEPPAAFYARVMDRIERQKTSSIWSVFLEPLFGRRLMYAAAALTMILGVALFTSPREADEAVMADSEPVQEMLTEDLPATQLVNAEEDRNTVFVQFVTFQE